MNSRTEILQHAQEDFLIVEIIIDQETSKLFHHRQRIQLGSDHQTQRTYTLIRVDVTAGNGRSAINGNATPFGPSGMTAFYFDAKLFNGIITFLYLRLPLVIAALMAFGLKMLTGF